MSVVTNRAADSERGWAIDDAVVRLRRWGTEEVFTLPAPATDTWTIGAAPDCELVLDDPTGCVSRRHARLARERGAWIVHDLESTNGIRQDGERRVSVELAPGVEVEIGGVTLIAESEQLLRLSAFLSRIIGWSRQRLGDVDRALRVVRDVATLRAVLVLCGAGDLSAVVRRIMDLALGGERPFVVGGVSAIDDLRRAATGTLLLAGENLPDDVRAVLDAHASPTSNVRLVVCAPSRGDATEAIANAGRTATIDLPAIATRDPELDRLVDAYAADAAIKLGAARVGFREHEMHWLRELHLASLEEIQDVTHRLVALRNWGVTGGAQRLGISHVALSRWARRRKIPT